MTCVRLKGFRSRPLSPKAPVIAIASFVAPAVAVGTPPRTGPTSRR